MSFGVKKRNSQEGNKPRGNDASERGRKNKHVAELLELAGAAQISPIVKLQVSAIRANNANKMANVVQAACKEAVLGQGKAIGAAGGTVASRKISAAVAKAVQGQAQSAAKKEPSDRLLVKVQSTSRESSLTNLKSTPQSL